MAQGTYTTAAARREPLLVELALHRVGTIWRAFAWGVIDRLPEEPRLAVDGISDTGYSKYYDACACSGEPPSRSDPP
jgi:hypothetical protein